MSWPLTSLRGRVAGWETGIPRGNLELACDLCVGIGGPCIRCHVSMVTHVGCFRGLFEEPHRLCCGREGKRSGLAIDAQLEAEVQVKKLEEKLRLEKDL